MADAHEGPVCIQLEQFAAFNALSTLPQEKCDFGEVHDGRGVQQ